MLMSSAGLKGLRARTGAQDAEPEEATPDEDAADICAEATALREALEAFDADLSAITDRLRKGRTDTLAADAAAVSARLAELDVMTRAWQAAGAQNSETLHDALTNVKAGVETHQRLVAALRDAAGSLAAQAKREQVKHAGGGLYAPDGAAPGAGGRVIGRL